MLAHREEGATLVEYCLLLGLIALMCIIAITAFGGDVAGLFAPAVDIL
jgi:Flp pilus assembly pilin Flp